MRYVGLALGAAVAVAGIVTDSAWTSRFGAQAEAGRSGAKLSLQLVWSTSADDKQIFDEGVFPPPDIEGELKRDDVPEADKQWLLNALRVAAARKDRVLYTDDGRAISLPKDGLLRWQIATSRNFKYLMLCPQRWDSEARQELESKASLQPPDPLFFYFGSEKVQQARKDLAEYERLEKESDFTFMDSEGNELWRRHGLPGRVHISNDGKTVVATHRGHWFGSASFYDSKGESIRKVDFPYGAGGNAALSPNGQLFAVIADLASEDGYSTVIAYGARGDRLWRTRLPGKPNVSGTARRVFCSTTGRFAVVSFHSPGKAYLLDRNGNMVTTFGIVATWAEFSATDSHVVVVGRGKVGLAETEQGTVVLTAEGKLTERVGIDPKGQFFVLVGRSGPREGPRECRIEVVDRKGEVLRRSSVKATPGYWPQCHISVEGSYIMVDTGLVSAILDLTGLR